jgi:hypothetical protein
MTEIAVEKATSEQVVLSVLTRLNHGNIDDAIARFAEEFAFKDRGIVWVIKTPAASAINSFYLCASD